MGTAFSYVFPANTFSDADTSDTLSYTATKAADTALPLWLAFAAGTRTFSGTPTDAGMVALKVTASDGNGGSVSDTFDITVAADTTPPTLTSAGVNEAGLFILLGFSENLQLSNLPPASAFTVTAGGSAVTVGGVLPRPGAPDVFVITVSPAIRQGQAIVVTYTDPTAGDDATAFQDVAGNDAASFTTGSDGVPAVTNASTVAPAATEVPADWSLKPTAVTAGDQFRLLFLSSTKRNASSTDIADYNTFIQTRAAAGHTDIQAYSAGFRVVGCTADTDARDNTVHHLHHHRQGRAHLLARRRQGRRPVRGFLRRVLGRRGQRQERVRHRRARYLPDRQLPLDRLQSRRHRGARWWESSRGLGSASVRVGPSQFLRFRLRPPQQHRRQRQTPKIAPCTGSRRSSRWPLP